MDIPEKPAQQYEHVIEFNSPWLQFDRPSFPAFEGKAACDVAIVGGGISGISTLYYLLTETDKTVILFEKEKIASQATGNNAALACLHIERPVQELVEEFGIEKTRQSFQEIDASWDLMEEILEKIDAKELLLPLPNISLGMTSVDVLLGQVERERYNRAFGRPSWHDFVRDDVEMPKLDDVDIHIVSKDELLQKLQIVDEDFIGIAMPKDPLKFGRLNSAKFCHAIIKFLSKEYPGRFSIFENSSIDQVQQLDRAVVLNGSIHAQDVILCTNGYKNFKIFTKENTEITRLQKGLIPREGYMAGYFDASRKPYAQAFFDDREVYKDSPYFYLSHIEEFTVLGGPEYDQPDGRHTKEQIAQRAHASQKIYQTFLKNTYNISEQTFTNFWYGIMGYTTNGVRWVGEEPKLPHLWYNLGCNGIGLTTSIGAAKRLVALLKGEKLAPSIFDIAPSE